MANYCEADARDHFWSTPPLSCVRAERHGGAAVTVPAVAVPAAASTSSSGGKADLPSATMAASMHQWKGICPATAGCILEGDHEGECKVASMEEEYYDISNLSLGNGIGGDFGFGFGTHVLSCCRVSLDECPDVCGRSAL